MKLLVADYSGHPFQVQLARELARRGHTVRHIFYAGVQTPKGNMLRHRDDPPEFDIAHLNTAQVFQKGSMFKRRSQEIEVGHLMAAELRRFRPDVTLSSNAPLDTQRILQKAARESGSEYIIWLQDIVSEAISQVVPRKLPVVGHLVGAHYTRQEFAMLRAAKRIVAITEDFVNVLAAKGIDRGKIDVIENWATLDELPLLPRENPWSAAHMPGEALRIVYSGTLGYKHNPRLLLQIAQRLPQAHVYVFSEGDVADALAAEAAAGGVANLSVHAWVPYADLPGMLAGADMLVAMIEAEAGIYCVPSKILTYMAMGRPILAAVPPENLASRLIKKTDAGLVAPPMAIEQLLQAAETLAGQPGLRARMGANGRAYAERAFDITAIGNRFEQVIELAVAGSGRDG